MRRIMPQSILNVIFKHGASPWLNNMTIHVQGSTWKHRHPFIYVPVIQKLKIYAGHNKVFPFKFLNVIC